ncbi:threonine aldolase [Devosia limi DSM 17137]|uniref:Threonine aldolase n=1 Tax=Devosia limi DSM 17137 TaxID=1121477 RepID=A0A0F5LWP2_9HYPH|nr:low-specificity L-threonine aldolase [Devosia limi]KKB86589.1 threonine aldolase [Devosia limi DSM 17137]SHF65459.1 L-threonine aldolase [Devosia limi DSM 17137]
MTAIRYDFRSDTVTRPSAAMRTAMMGAEVGDDVFGDDPTVSRLEAVMAERLGKQAAIFVPSGTQSNLLALMSHCGRGDEYIAGQQAHCYRWEGGGAAVLGSIQPQPIEHQADGTMALADIEAAIKPDDSHFAPAKVIALENTFGGRVLPFAYMQDVAALVGRRGLGLHLDGARAFNASVKLGMDIAAFTAAFDTVSICLSKGLGAPVGSVLVGRQDLIDKARRHRKMLGGGMRQAGILAAAGLYALEHNVARLADDHARARRLAEGLARHEALRVTMPDTNIVFIDMDASVGEKFTPYLQGQGVGVTGRYGQQRWVTHLDVDEAAVDASLALVDGFFRAA